MTKFVALLLAVIGFALMGIGLALFMQSPLGISLILVPSGAGVIYWAYRWDARSEKSIEYKRLEMVSSRVDSLTKKPWSHNQVLEIKRSSFIVFVSCLVWIAIVFYTYSITLSPVVDWSIFMLGCFFSVMFLFVLLRLLCGFGKPSLLLNVQGFVTPLYGMIQWPEVEGINLYQQTMRGQKNSFLYFKIGNFSSSGNDIHWTEKILSSFGIGAIKRKVIPVFLNGAKEEPEAIYAVARFLWKQSTGLHHDWNPMFSGEMNQAMRRVHDLSAQSLDIQTLADNLRNAPEKELQKANQFSRDMQIINKEVSRQTRRYRLALYAGLLGLLVIIFWPFIQTYI